MFVWLAICRGVGSKLKVGEQKGGGRLDLSEILTSQKKFLVMIMYKGAVPTPMIFFFVNKGNKE